MPENNSTTMSVDEAMACLETMQYRMVGLPTMFSGGLYLFFHRNLFHFVRVQPPYDGSISSYQAFTPTSFREFLFDLMKSREDKGILDWLLQPWDGSGGSKFWQKRMRGRKEKEIDSQRLRTAVEVLEEVTTQLLEYPRSSVCTRGGQYIYYSPWFQWTMLYSETQAFTLPDHRAHAEILSDILLGDTDRTSILEKPPIMNDLFHDSDSFFAEHGPTSHRILWLPHQGSNRMGLTLDNNGLYRRITFSGEMELVNLFEVTILPTFKACELLFDTFHKGKCTHGSQIPSEIIEVLEQASQIEHLASWLKQSRINISAGEFRPSGWIADSTKTLFDTYHNRSYPFEEAASVLMDGEHFFSIRFEELVNLSELARKKDPKSKFKFRYIIPSEWSPRFSTERYIEKVTTAVFAQALNTPWKATRTEVDGSVRYEHTYDRHIHIGSKECGVHLYVTPQESGHGVHGSSYTITFHGLPDGISIQGTASNSAIRGGFVDLQFSCPGKLAKQLKVICHEVLP